MNKRFVVCDSTFIVENNRNAKEINVLSIARGTTSDTIS